MPVSRRSIGSSSSTRRTGGFERLAVIDRLILRMAVWELQHQPDTPPAVVIDEAIELARTFSTDDSVKFVNGVLDAIRLGLGRA